MKTYVLTVSTCFPKSHPRAGEPTWFVEGVNECRKIHTIRKNYQLWAKRFKKIDAGEAVLSLRIWEGKPYRSKQFEFMRLDKSHGIGLEKIRISELSGYASIATPEGYARTRIGLNDISKNDGLILPDFLEWFQGVKETEELAIIHFTPFRYQ